MSEQQPLREAELSGEKCKQGRGGPMWFPAGDQYRVVMVEGWNWQSNMRCGVCGGGLPVRAKGASEDRK
jgi:hypothetical protein